MKIIIYADPGQAGLTNANYMRDIILSNRTLYAGLGEDDVDVVVMQSNERSHVSHMASGQDGEAD